ncbi:MAG: isoleucine--tRNA ligase [Bacteroidales bacterium]|nr:isoleucine--tRNA ligase [Candidatus Cacconaster merdequi]
MKFTEHKKFDLVETNREILEKWKKDDTFKETLSMSEGAPRFIFHEGPPSANGMPGIHHVMARSIKDAICRYKTQTGYRVERRAGWDTHGLPVELGVEKMLGITKEDIGKKVSVDDYNNACRREVMKYTAEWRKLTEQIGYWVDMDNPYITYDNRYIETLWYLLKEIYKKGYLYKGYTIQPYSPAAGTGLSSHELNQPGCYRDVKDTTAVVQFKVVRNETSEFLFEGTDLPVYIIAWTTTPWTLPSNTALCVGPKIEYVCVDSVNPYSKAPARYVVALPLLGAHFNDRNPFTVVGKPFLGTALSGVEYEQLIPWVKCAAGGLRVITGDFVTTEDGTGIVHIAPTFGADDNKVAKQSGVPPMFVLDADGSEQPMVDRTGKLYRIEDMDASFVKERVDIAEYGKYAGRYVKNAYDSSLAPDAPTLDIDICLDLKAQGKAFNIAKHTHSYPHCWRTDKPVLYYPLDSWFIRSTAVQERMIELNKTINWKPESTGSGRFGKWLENLQDWNLSRSRYWGTPLPIWRTEDGSVEKCIGSVAELYEEIEKAVKAGVMPSNPFAEKGFVPGDFSKENYGKIDLHRPYVDNIFLVSDDGRKMVRELDLIDVWFDSGSMPYAQEGLAKLGTPQFGQTADFIAEGVDQTRGWFFTLHAINTMVSDKCAFKSVISNGLVLDKDGNKMSKRLGNAVNPFEALDKFGADSLRWYMLTNAQPWDNLKFDEAGVEEVRRKFFGTLYNTYSFFALYANVDGFNPEVPEVAKENLQEIDLWLVSLLNTLVRKVRAAYEDYDLTNAGRLLQDFVCDDLSNWYVRLNRKRFWGGGMTDSKLAAYQTLYNALKTVAVLAAPIAPFYMDQLYCDLVPAAKSVHFERMPECCEEKVDASLEERMSLAQQCCSMVLALRRKVNIKVRQPLAKIVIPVLDDAVEHQLEKVKKIVLSEVNVKEAEFIHDTTGLITKKIKPNFKTLGKRYGARMKEIASFFTQMDQQTISAIERAGDYTLNLAGGDVALTKEDYQITSEDMPGWLVTSEGTLTVALDVTVTDELRREGIARELINRIQNVRKESGFEVTDRVNVVIEESEKEIADAMSQFSQYVCDQTLAYSVSFSSNLENPVEVEWNDGVIKLSVTKVK